MLFILRLLPMILLAELYKSILLQKGANKESHQKWDFIVNLGL